MNEKYIVLKSAVPNTEEERKAIAVRSGLAGILGFALCEEGRQADLNPRLGSNMVDLTGSSQYRTTVPGLVLPYSLLQRIERGNEIIWDKNNPQDSAENHYAPKKRTEAGNNFKFYLQNHPALLIELQNVRGNLRRFLGLELVLPEEEEEESNSAKKETSNGGNNRKGNRKNNRSKGRKKRKRKRKRKRR